MATDPADDRRYVIEQWQYLFGRQPTVDELNYSVGFLQAGQDRSVWLANAERAGAEEAVKRLYMETLGREPNSAELLWQSTRIRNGDLTRKALLQQLAGSAEGLLREPEEEPDPDAENALTYLNNVLEGYGLGGLGDWAWQQIQEGYSPDRIIQNLRQRDEYKQRFIGLERRREAGLPAISEAEYIAYETDVRQMMRAAGLPADFYDSPEDFATFIGNDVSPMEMQARINEGYLAASQAPPEVRQQLETLYGVGQGQLAAFFLDPDRALPLIERQFQASQISAAAQRTTYGSLDAAEAERLASLGITDQEAQQGFGALAERKELFQAMPGIQGEEGIDRAMQQRAIFEGDASALAAIERRAGSRVAQGRGSQGFALGETGVSALGE
jgi:hypothetical protein